MNGEVSTGQELPYEICHSEELGRYLVAGRDLEALEVIILEKPLFCSPADDSSCDSPVFTYMCLGCFAKLTPNSKSHCSKCSWPVCDKACESILHHSQNECTMFQCVEVSPKELPYRHLLNESIFILRGLFMKHKYPDLWERIVMKFEHHNSVRMGKPDCVEKDRKVLMNLNKIKNALENTPDFSWFTVDSEEVSVISGIINVNAFSSTKLEDECRSRRVRRRVTICQCLYPTATLLAHQCVPNCSWTVSASPHFEQTIRTTIRVKKGEMLSIAYATQEVLWGTLQRLISTSEVAHFICQCYRCKDPTELGTFIGALKCDDCEYDDDDSYVLPLEPTNPDSMWSCLKCKSTMSVQKVCKVITRIERQFERIKNSTYSSEDEVTELEELYEDSLNDYLHKNHYILHDISLRIVNRNALSLHALTCSELERYLFHCFTVLKLTEILSPGYCRARAIVQFHASQALLVKARKSVKGSNITEKSKLIEMYKPIYKMQKEAYTYFKTEDENDNRHKAAKGFNQFVACLVEGMEESLRLMQLS